MMRGAVLAWWFVVMLPGSTGHAGNNVSALGPFRDRMECEQIRAWLGDRGKETKSRIDVTWCWWDGKP